MTSLRGLGDHYNPWLAGQAYPYVALRSSISSESPGSGYTIPDAGAALFKLPTLTKKEDLAAQARKLAQIYRESEIRKLLWANHNPFGVRKRIRWQPIPGWPYVLGIEFAELAG